MLYRTTKAAGKSLLLILLAGFLMPGQASAQTAKKSTAEMITLSTQKRIASDLDTSASVIVNEITSWDPKQTAVIICDMWNQHWCKGATARVAEMAPRLNEVLAAAREKGMLIVHAPSDCMDYYKDHPGRKMVLKNNIKKYEKIVSSADLPTEDAGQWPIDQSDGGCDELVKCSGGSPWKKQIDAIEIKDGDAISDSGAEMAALFDKKGIKNVILTGVHTNMCIIGRTFGLRSMVRLGKNVVLMRDMTDAMYNSRKRPFVNHFTGVQLVVNYIERYVCPTILSTDFIGGKQFRFNNDERPVVAFITAEGEYRANQRLPEFANYLMLREGVSCEFAIGKPAMEGAGRHNIENLQILNDADLAVLFVRRVALEPEKMQMVRNYFQSGKPLLGIRTASHSFDAKGNVPREGGGVSQSNESVSGYLAQWPEFDAEIIGGNYQGHYAHLEEPTKIKVVPGMESHPILKNVNAGGFDSPNWLYKNKPLRSERAQVLLLGSIPGEDAEPVLWTNRTANNSNVVYTSLGHWDDWKIPAFHTLMVNSVNYLLGRTTASSK